MAKYTWRPTPKALRNIVILLVLIILIIVWIASGISKGIKNAAAKKAARTAAKEVTVLREDYEELGVTFPSGVINTTVTHTLPSTVTDYIWYYNNQSLFDSTLKSYVQGNADLTHFLKEYGSGTASSTGGALTNAELSGGVPTYYQWDERWGFDEYGDTVIGLDGGGPTAMSMAIVGLTGNAEATPSAVASYAESEDLYYSGYGSAWALVPYAADEFGLTYEEVILDEDALKSQLDEGHVVVLVMSENSSFSPGTGFILLTGYDSSGFIIRDPLDASNNAKEWSYSSLSSYIDAIWAVWAESVD